MSDSKGGPWPAVAYLKLPEAGGEPWLEGLCCGECGAMFLDRRTTCSKCGGRGSLAPRRLSERGTLHAFSIIYRSFPGVAVPYVSAVVDLDGGGCVKGNLRGVEPDPRHVEAGMRVQLAFELAPARDDEGNAYMAYYFEPEGGAA